MPIEEYEFGQPVGVRVTLRNEAGVEADPGVEEIVLCDPDGVTIRRRFGVDLEVEREAAGIYKYEFIPGKPGAWEYGGEGSGDFICVTARARFVVRTRRFAA